MYRAIDRESGETLYKSKSMDVVITWTNFQNNLPNELGFGFTGDKEEDWQRLDYHLTTPN